MQKSLSKKDLKTTNVYPYFFIAALEVFEVLRRDNKINKPKIDTMRDEATIEYNFKDKRQLLIQYVYPNFIEIHVGVKGAIWTSYVTFHKMFNNITGENVNHLKDELKTYLHSISDEINNELNKLKDK